jgi:hypothetical protein
MAAATLAASFATSVQSHWRRALVSSGFPLSIVACGLSEPVPAWAWLVPLGLVAWVYPPRAWRDAPFFPTPVGALHGLCERVPLAAGAAVLDAGCGLGHGLRELRGQYPNAVLSGLEWSRPLRLLCAWRCPDARVRRADIWAEDWSGFAMVYVFQRPESMPRVALKAARELSAGAWLASLEFEVPDWSATATLTCADGRPLWLYRIGAVAAHALPVGAGAPAEAIACA